MSLMMSVRRKVYAEYYTIREYISFTLKVVIG